MPDSACALAYPPYERLMRTAALLLAAGQSSRMGSPKPLLHWPDALGNPSTVIRVAYESLAPFSNGGVFVTLSKDGGKIESALAALPLAVIRVPVTSERMVSVRLALQVVSAAMPPVSHVLLHPGDHPVIRPQTLQTLLAHSTPEKAVMPEYRGKGGHPVLIPRAIWPLILVAPNAGGLAQFWRENQRLRTRLAVEDPATTLEMNTWRDYHEARARFITT